MSPLVFLLLHLSVLAYAFVGGVFLAFSDFIMRALSLTTGDAGIETMQVINREVFRWVFMALFLGMAGVSAFIAIYSLLHVPGGPGVMIFAGALIYLLGCFLVTVVFNVPMNEALGGMALASDATQSYWTGAYLPRWTAWNSVRTLACAAASALMLFGLVWLTQMQARLD